jgi:hypothetical protein
MVARTCGLCTLAHDARCDCRRVTCSLETVQNLDALRRQTHMSADEKPDLRTTLQYAYAITQIAISRDGYMGGSYRLCALVVCKDLTLETIISE